MMHLRDLNSQIAAKLKGQAGKLDPYTRAHLEDIQVRVTKALESQYIFNAREIGGMGGLSFLFSRDAAPCDDATCRHCSRGK